MSTPILATKLHVPLPRTKAVLRPRLIDQLNEGLHHRLSLISAPAGFGKSTLVSEWVAGCERRVSWLSLDEEDNDAVRFLTYLIAALQTISANIGKGLLGVLQSPQPPQAESILFPLLNEISAIPDNFILVLDDYHVIHAAPVDNAITFLIEHLPPQMHLVIATREDPHLSLARLRARGQLTELRAADLRFTPAEAAEFLNQAMGLNLSTENIAALEARTEGWIAGLQLAAISMRGHQDLSSFISSFTGSHHFVLDYLVEEVLQQQTERVQTFLLRTSILDRMCGPLCDALLPPSDSGQETLERLEHANLFIVPLDHERRWYRYHHLFAELLRQRLHQTSALSAEDKASNHIRASEWYEKNDLMLEAFHHAAAANDVERAARLIEGKGMPLHIPGAATAILNWLQSLPTTVLNAQPELWWKQAELMLTIGQTSGVEERLLAIEAALPATVLPGAELDDTTRSLIGKIALARAILAQTLYHDKDSLVQARRALEYLHPDDLHLRSTATQVIGFAHYIQGDRAEAGRTYVQALSIAQAAGDVSDEVMARTRLGQIQEQANQLYLAAETYQHALQLIGDNPPPNAAVVYLGLARIYFEWNDLDAAEKYGELSLNLSRQYDQIIDRLILSELFLAGLKLARGDAVDAARILSQTEQTARQKNFAIRLPDIAAAQALVHLWQGNLVAAAQLGGQYDLPLIRARVLIAEQDPSAALAVLEPQRQQAQARDWADRLLSVMTLQSIALFTHGEKEKAVELFREVLALAEPGGFTRLFVDEGEPMRLLISEFRSWIQKQPHRQDHRPVSYIEKLVAAFPEPRFGSRSTIENVNSKMPEPLSQRELEVLRLVAEGLSNREICARLFLALDTVKGHNRRIFDKLQVQRRTEAIVRAHELGLL